MTTSRTLPMATSSLSSSGRPLSREVKTCCSVPPPAVCSGDERTQTLSVPGLLRGSGDPARRGASCAIHPQPVHAQPSAGLADLDGEPHENTDHDSKCVIIGSVMT